MPMPWRAPYVRNGTLLYDGAFVQDDDRISDFRNEGQSVGDKKRRRGQLFRHLVKQPDGIRLCDQIKLGCRFVGDDEFSL